MILTATICLLSGAVLGLKFNLKMIVHATVLSTIVWVVAAASGGLSISSAALHAVIAAFALQAGYFASLLVAALGLTGDNEAAAVVVAKDSRAFEAPSELRKNV